MNNITKMVCDLINLGTQIARGELTSEQATNKLCHTLMHTMPPTDRCQYDDVADHIEALLHCKGADNDIDVTRVIEFHGYLTLLLTNGKEKRFPVSEISHY